jgi:hypothetical protein
MQCVCLQLDSRIMCGCNVEDEMVLLGTLAWDLIAFSVHTRSVRVHPH